MMLLIDGREFFSKILRTSLQRRILLNEREGVNINSILKFEYLSLFFSLTLIGLDALRHGVN